MKGQVEFHVATAGDIDVLLRMMQEFCAFGEPLPYDRELRRRLLQEFIQNPEIGRIWMIDLENRPVGYIVASFGYSFEYRGRDALIDEFFVAAELRGQGVGRQTLEFVKRVCDELGINALHLEVDRDNPNAEHLYRSFGFQGNGRTLLTKWTRQ